MPTEAQRALPGTRAALDLARREVAEMTLPPPAPLRRPPPVALVSIQAEAERLLRGQETADRRQGPGRRQSDYVP